MKLFFIFSALAMSVAATYAGAQELKPNESACQGTTSAGDKIDLRYDLNLDGKANPVFKLKLNGTLVNIRILRDVTNQKSAEFTLIAPESHDLIYVNEGGGGAVVNFKNSEVKDLNCGGQE